MERAWGPPYVALAVELRGAVSVVVNVGGARPGGGADGVRRLQRVRQPIDDTVRQRHRQWLGARVRQRHRPWLGAGASDGVGLAPVTALLITAWLQLGERSWSDYVARSRAGSRSLSRVASTTGDVRRSCCGQLTRYQNATASESGSRTASVSIP